MRRIFCVHDSIERERARVHAPVLEPFFNTRTCTRAFVQHYFIIIIVFTCRI
jgi:hypothetical protein